MISIKNLLIVCTASFSLILPMAVPAASDVGVPSTVQIEALTCGLNFDVGSPSTIDYGSLLPNEVSSEQSVAVINTGNANGDFSISGTNWHVPGDPDVVEMLVSTTHFSPQQAGIAYDSKLVLSTTPADMGTAQAGSTYAFYFQLKPVLENPGFSGALTQQVNFGTEC